MTLSIDTHDKDQVVISLYNGGTEINKLTANNKFGSQVILQLIEQILDEAHITKTDLKHITIATGPGSYTGIRVGVAVANALGFALGIPVNGKTMETELIYE